MQKLKLIKCSSLMVILLTVIAVIFITIYPTIVNIGNQERQDWKNHYMSIYDNCSKYSNNDTILDCLVFHSVPMALDKETYSLAIEYRLNNQPLLKSFFFFAILFGIVITSLMVGIVSILNRYYPEKLIAHGLRLK